MVKSFMSILVALVLVLSVVLLPLSQPMTAATDCSKASNIHLEAQATDMGEIHSGETCLGNIMSPSDIDSWTFEGSIGNRIIANAEPTSGDLTAQLYLYPPDGGEFEAYTPTGNARLDHQIEHSGLYTLIVQDFGSYGHAGDYQISLAKIPSTLAPGIYNPFPANGATITYLNQSFTWDAVEGATSYDLYFGEDVIIPLEKIGENFSSHELPFPEMEVDKVYYWYVEAHTTGGTIQGCCCWFETSPLAQASLDVTSGWNISTENDTLASGIYDAIAGYGLSLCNLDDDSNTVLGELMYHVEADDIGWVSLEEYAERTETSVTWTFPPEFDLVEEDWLWTGYDTEYHEIREAPMSLNRNIDKTVFDSDGYQHAEFSVIFDNTDFEGAYVDLRADEYDVVEEVDASFLVDTFSTNMPYTTLKKEEHLIHVLVWPSDIIEPGVQYDFSVDVKVELTGNGAPPIIYKPCFSVGVTWREGPVGAVGGEAVIPSDMLPDHMHYASVSTNVSNTWYLMAIGIRSSSLREISEPTNNPPNIPSDPFPSNHAPDVSVDTDLSWTGGDPDPGDTLTYDVYFGASSPPPFQATIGPYPATQSSITYTPGTLSYNIPYYWRIVARDNHDASTEGPMWNFTTDWNDFDDDGVIDNDEILDAVYCWLTNAPHNGHLLTNDDILLLVYMWLTGCYSIVWDNDVQITNTGTPSFYPTLGVSESIIHLAWVDQRNGGENREIYYNHSNDSGVTWQSSDMMISNNSLLSIKAGFAVSGDMVHLFWRDNRDGNFEEYYTRSIRIVGFHGAPKRG